MREGIIFVVRSLLVITFLVSCTNCTNNDNLFGTKVDEEIDFNDTSFASIVEDKNIDLVIKQHYVSQKEENVKILRDDKTIALVKLGEPIVVAQADVECEWGWFQFPEVYFVEDGNLIVSWQMKPDSYTVYGEDSNARLISKDDGLSWVSINKQYYYKDNPFVELYNGNILQFYYCDSKDTKKYMDIPSPVNSEPINGRWFYKESDLPDELRGVYLESWDRQSGKKSLLHCYLEDPGLLRYSYSNDDLMPILWNGEMKRLDDGTLVAGKYPGYYQNSEGSVLECGISFYKSSDHGNNWKRIGVIPFQPEKGKNPESYIYNGGEGFNEPTFAILKDGTYVCVMRTGHNTPLYRSFSKDGGYNWSLPEPFTSNGVCPNLLLLDNGVLVLSSGRPGVQLRFNIDGDGKDWSEPIEMLPFMDEDGRYGNNIYKWPTCGYTSILAVDDHTFYFVWSDFKRKNKLGEERKSIMFRKVEVIKKY